MGFVLGLLCITIVFALIYKIIRVQNNNETKMGTTTKDLCDIERNRKLFLQEVHKRYLVKGRRNLH